MARPSLLLCLILLVVESAAFLHRPPLRPPSKIAATAARARRDGERESTGVKSTVGGAVLGGLIGGPFGAIWGAQIGANMAESKRMRNAFAEDDMSAAAVAKRLGLDKEVVELARTAGAELSVAQVRVRSLRREREREREGGRERERERCGGPVTASTRTRGSLGF